MEKTNILVFICDQLSGLALSYNGDRYAKTPNIDRIRNGGINFETCYCSFPLCQPSRASFWSGVYPHETKVLSNGRRWPTTLVPDSFPTIGTIFQNAGYRTVHFGKCHSAGALRGFEIIESEQIRIDSENPAYNLGYGTFHDEDTCQKVIDFLKNNDTAPFFAVADFQNPHDICGFIGDNRDKHVNIDPGVELPKLPENFDFADIENRPKAVQYICCSHNRQAQTGEWEPEDFRYYLAAYYYFISLVDKKIGLVLDALEESGHLDDTLIVLMADHGEGMAAKRLVTKQVCFYETVTRVPFIIKGPGVAAREDSIRDYPVSTLDLFPTLCGYAGLAIPEGLRGVDLSDVLRGGNKKINREYVACEWHTEWGFTVSPGRMIRTQRFKYTNYIEDRGEELFDMEKDPLEQKNLVQDPAYRQTLEDMRKLFHQHLQQSNDDFLSQTWKADPRWRSHPVGYHNHRGPAAPEAIEPVFNFSAVKIN